MGHQSASAFQLSQIVSVTMQAELGVQAAQLIAQVEISELILALKKDKLPTFTKDVLRLYVMGQPDHIERQLGPDTSRHARSYASLSSAINTSSELNPRPPRLIVNR